MNTAVVLLVASVISSMSYAQTKAGPKQIRASAVTQRNNQYPKAPLSLDGYLTNSKNKCMNRVANQIKSLTEKNDKAFQAYNSAAGAKLAKMDSRCKYFRFELIDYTEDFSNGSYTSDMRFTYRCYETADVKLPSQRVAQAPLVVINPVSLYEDIGDKNYDDDIIKEKCDALSIAKKINANLDKTLESGNFQTEEASGKSRGSSSKPFGNTKKSNTRN